MEQARIGLIKNAKRTVFVADLFMLAMIVGASLAMLVAFALYFYVWL